MTPQSSPAMPVDLPFLKSALEVTQTLIDFFNSDSGKKSQLNDEQIAEIGCLLYYVRYNAFKGQHYRCLETWLLFLVKYCRVTNIRKHLPYLDQLMHTYKGDRLAFRLQQSTGHFQQQIDKWLRGRVKGKNRKRIHELKRTQVSETWAFVFDGHPLPLDITGTKNSGVFWVAQMIPYEKDSVIQDLEPMGRRRDGKNNKEWRVAILKDMVLNNKLQPQNLTDSDSVQSALEKSFQWGQNNVMGYREVQVRLGKAIGDDMNFTPPWDWARAKPRHLTTTELTAMSTMGELPPSAENITSYFARVEAAATAKFQKEQQNVVGAIKCTRAELTFKAGGDQLDGDQIQSLQSRWKELRKGWGRLRDTSIDKPHYFKLSDNQEAFVYQDAEPKRVLRSNTNKNGKESISVILSLEYKTKTVFARVSRTAFNKVASAGQKGAAEICEQTFSEFGVHFEPGFTILTTKLNENEKIPCLIIRKSQVSATALAKRLPPDSYDRFESQFPSASDQDKIKYALKEAKKKPSTQRWKFCNNTSAFIGYTNLAALKIEASK
jgi:hypothetical protein